MGATERISEKITCSQICTSDLSGTNRQPTLEGEGIESKGADGFNRIGPNLT